MEAVNLKVRESTRCTHQWVSVFLLGSPLHGVKLCMLSFSEKETRVPSLFLWTEMSRFQSLCCRKSDPAEHRRDSLHSEKQLLMFSAMAVWQDRENCWAVIKEDEYCFWAGVFCLSLCDLCTEVMVSRPERVTLNWFDGLMNSLPRSISGHMGQLSSQEVLSLEKKRHNHLPLGKPDDHSSQVLLLMNISAIFEVKHVPRCFSVTVTEGNAYLLFM